MIPSAMKASIILSLVTLAMAKAGKILISGNNTVGRGLNGVQFNYAGAIDHKLALGDVDTPIDIEIRGNNNVGSGLNAVQHNEFGSEDNGGSNRKHESGPGPKHAGATTSPLGSGGIVGVVFGTLTAIGMIIGLAIQCSRERDHIETCFGCNEKKPGPAQNKHEAQNNLQEYELQ